MSIEKFRWLAGVIAAHPGRRVHGRTRLQKEMRLLQRCGLPAGYRYMLYFYGPYSEGIQSDVALLEQLGLVTESDAITLDNKPYFIIKANSDAELPQIAEFQPKIDLLDKTDATVLELAATYDAFRELGFDHVTSLKRLLEKKGEKCDDGRDQKALDLLEKLGLEHS